MSSKKHKKRCAISFYQAASLSLILFLFCLKRHKDHKIPSSCHISQGKKRLETVFNSHVGKVQKQQKKIENVARNFFFLSFFTEVFKFSLRSVHVALNFFKPSENKFIPFSLFASITNSPEAVFEILLQILFMLFFHYAHIFP